MFQLQHKNSSKGPLWLVEKKYVIGSGSGSGCDVPVTGDAVSESHAEIVIERDQVSLVNLVGVGLSVDGQAVAKHVTLRPGSVITIGDEELELVDPKANVKAAPAAAPSGSQSGWALKALNTALADKKFPLQGTQVIGRSKDCDVSLGVVHLSRKHAKITVTDRGLVIEDLGSSNGTYINNKKVSRATATAGDEISFDTMRFRVIGPVIDDDKTTLRPSSLDGDLTTVRPALNIPQNNQSHDAKHSKEQGKARARTHTTGPHSAGHAHGHTHSAKKQARQTQGSEENDSKGVAIILIGLVVVLGAAAAWFFLK